MDEHLLLSFERLEREHWWFVARRRMVLDVVTAAAPASGARIVEVGCGTGGLLAELRRRYPETVVSGVEPSAAAASVARRGSTCEVTEAVLEALPFSDATVDLVLALDVFEHCADDVAAAQEVARVLRPGGRLIATVPALPLLWSAHDVANAHHRRYVKSTLRAPMAGAGLTVHRLTYFNTLLMPAGLAGRLLSRLTRSPAGTGVALPPRPLNALMRSIFGTETRLLRHVDLPTGMSLLIVADKPAM